MSHQDLHDKQNADRNRYTDLIVQSTAKNKIIVAGPGTGKTTTFRKLLETKNGDKLALTFINSLAFDLQKGLGELAESYTFHGYCKKLLHKISVDGIDTNFHYYPKLPILIKTDADLIDIDLDKFVQKWGQPLLGAEMGTATIGNGRNAEMGTATIDVCLPPFI